MMDNLSFEASRIEPDESRMTGVAIVLMLSCAAIVGVLAGAVYVGWSWL